MGPGNASGTRASPDLRSARCRGRGEDGSVSRSLGGRRRSERIVIGNRSGSACRSASAKLGTFVADISNFGIRDHPCFVQSAIPPDRLLLLQVQFDHPCFVHEHPSAIRPDGLLPFLETKPGCVNVTVNGPSTISSIEHGVWQLQPSDVVASAP